MKKCDCYHIEEEIIGWHTPVDPKIKMISKCWGTKEREKCSCGGDRTKCDFYPEVRKKAYKEDNMLIDTIETDNKIISFLLDQHAQTKNANFIIAASVIDHLIRENRYLTTEHKWISVEDRLPESGIHCLLCCDIKRYDGTHRQYVCDGYYAAKYTEECSNVDDDVATEYNEEDDEYYLCEGWYEVINNWDDYSSVAIDDFVTHWMPLPSPPTEKEN